MASIDAFILFNEREDAVESIVSSLELLKVTTYFWRRDISVGENWQQTEAMRLQEARSVVVFLGDAGWGRNHLLIAEKSQGLQKRIIPVLIGDPPADAMEQAGGLFTVRRYLDLRNVDDETLQQLADAIQQGTPSSTEATEFADFQVRPGSNGITPDAVEPPAVKLVEKHLAKRGLAVKIELVEALRIAESLAPQRETEREILSTRLVFFSLMDLLLARNFPGEFQEVANFFRSFLLANRSAYSACREQYFTSPSQTSRGTIEAISVNLDRWLIEASKLASALDVTEVGISIMLGAITRLNDGQVLRTCKQCYVDIGQLREILSSLEARARSGAKARSNANKKSGATPGNIIAGFLADASGVSVEDLLDVKIEVAAFARLAASRNVSPPLSIGIFGEWGSGKTFFMERMYEEVNRLAELNTGREHFHSNIVQIRFNAWHYIETNLWASLVDSIFQDLDRWLRGKNKEVETLFDELTTSKQLRLEAVTELIEARKRKEAAEVELETAKEMHIKALNEHMQSPLQDIWSAAAATFKESLRDDDKAKLKTAGEELGLPQIETSATALAQVVKDCHREGKRTRLLVNSMLHTYGSRRAVLASVAMLLLIPLGLEALRVLLSFRFSFLDKVNAGVLGVSSAISTVAVVAGYSLKIGRRALNVFAGFSEKLDQAVKSSTAQQRQAVAAAEKLLSEMVKKVVEAERRVAAATDAATAAEQNYQNDTARGRLNRFIRERVADGTYARHLGLIATIRKDFARLAEIMKEDSLDSSMAKELEAAREGYRHKIKQLIEDNPNLLSEKEIKDLQREVPVDQLRHFERIVLYIDDLDRCPPDKVAEVLQAIHMLLFFPLFVVVVAVDARWVGRSLEMKFPHLISTASSDNCKDNGSEAVVSGGAGGQATALDYLEKIFQIPFWVRPMTDKASKDFVAGLTKHWVVRDEINPIPDWTADPGSAKLGGAQPVNAASLKISTSTYEDWEETPSIRVATNARTNAGNAKLTTGMVAPTGAVNADDPSIAFDTMRLSKAEGELLNTFAPFLGSSPRRAKRFVNLYLLIKAIFRHELPDVDSGGASVENSALVALLTIVTGAPHNAEAFFAALPAGRTSTCLELRDNLTFPAEAFRPREEQAVRSIVETLVNLTPNGDEMINALRDYSPTVQRYSFQGSTYQGRRLEQPRV